MPCTKCKNPRPSPKSPSKCFCGGKISADAEGPKLTGAAKVRAEVSSEKTILQAKKVKFSATLAAHLFEGEDDGNGHKGLHSMVRLRGRENATQHVKKTETDGVTGAYAAWVKLKGKTSSKASTFFPDTWSEDDVLEGIQKAFQAWRVGKGAAKGMIDGKGLSWAGFVTVKGVNLWIGGLGDGDSQAGIATAFPAVNGRFDDPNDGEEPKG